MTPEEKLRAVKTSIARCELGESETIACPYCKSVNLPNEPLCCETFAHAVCAILAEKETQDLLDKAAHIADNSSRN